MSFSEKIVERRVSLGLSQKELAERLGVTPARLNYWEKGKREPDVHYIKALARELEVSGDYLLETESEEDTNDLVTGNDMLDRIIKLMEEHKESKAALARNAGIPYTTIDGLFKRGCKNAYISTAEKISAYYDVTLDYLISGNEEQGINYIRGGKTGAIGERIKKARLEKGYTQLQLAEMIGVAKNTITGYETGTREPDSSRITAIANALNVSGDYIIGTEYDWLPSSAAMKIAAKYDKLDQHGRELINWVVDHEIRRVQSAVPAKRDTTKVTVEPPEAQLAAEVSETEAARDSAAQ